MCIQDAQEKVWKVTRQVITSGEAAEEPELELSKGMLP